MEDNVEAAQDQPVVAVSEKPSEEQANFELKEKGNAVEGFSLRSEFSSNSEVLVGDRGPGNVHSAAGNAAVLDVKPEGEKTSDEFMDVTPHALAAVENHSEKEQTESTTNSIANHGVEKPDEKMQETGDAVNNSGTESAVLQETGDSEDVIRNGETELGALQETRETLDVVQNVGTELGVSQETANVVKNEAIELQTPQASDIEMKKEPDTRPKCFLLDSADAAGNESGTEDEQETFMKELEVFHKENCLDFKPPKFYQEPLNCLKLWRAVIRLGGYERVTSLKLWRQVGESFHPPKTCTTVSWTFRGFYEKALIEYEKHKMRCGELPFTDTSMSELTPGAQVTLVHSSGSGRARRDAAARAMQGWHSQKRLGNGDVGDSNTKDHNQTAMPKREKQLKNIGLMKRKGASHTEQASKCARVNSKPHSEIMVVDVSTPADWVKINVLRLKDCYEIYALVPGLLREEVHVQTDPAGRVVISGQPEQQDNPWGVTPFRKVVSLPTRIDPHHTSAVVTLHGQLFVRVPFEEPVA